MQPTAATDILKSQEKKSLRVTTPKIFENQAQGTFCELGNFSASGELSEIDQLEEVGEIDKSGNWLNYYYLNSPSKFQTFALQV